MSIQNTPKLAFAQKKKGESVYSIKLKSRNAVCQVQGCDEAVPMKAYHQRYRICQSHISMQEIMKEGIRVRFCQHCGRFQPLKEFDDTRKSCRRSLDLHRSSQNRRRIKRETMNEPRPSIDNRVGNTSVSIKSNLMNDSGDSTKAVAFNNATPSQSEPCQQRQHREFNDSLLNNNTDSTLEKIGEQCLYMELHHASLKLFNARPDELPTSVKDTLSEMLLLPDSSISLWAKGHIDLL